MMLPNNYACSSFTEAHNVVCGQTRTRLSDIGYGALYLRSSNYLDRSLPSFCNCVVCASNTSATLRVVSLDLSMKADDYVDINDTTGSFQHTEEGGSKPYQVVDMYRSQSDQVSFQANITNGGAFWIAFTCKYCLLIYFAYLLTVGKVFQQTVDIPMGINCAHLLIDIFLYSYKAAFIQSLLSTGKKQHPGLI